MTRSSEHPASPYAFPAAPRPFRLALFGPPNVGKTTLFNRLCGAHHTTSNFPGTTQEARVGTTRLDHTVELIDLPGLYALHDGSEEAAACRRALSPAGDDWTPPDAVCLVIDVASLSRGLRLLRELLTLGTPTVVLLGTAGRREQIAGQPSHVGHALGVEVIYWNQGDADAGQAIFEAARRAADIHPAPRALDDDWIVRTSAALGTMLSPRRASARADRADGLLLHPILGMIVFVLVMWLLFWSVFSLAAYPMNWIEQMFALLSDATRSLLPAGALSDLLADGIIAGVGATVVFLPQIAMLFLLISILEESGYLARGALLADRLLRPFGLPGSAFVPLLSAHACAIPAIVACRTIRDVRERVAAILVAPFMSCSARLPVYALLVSFLFVDQPARQATAFISAYIIGAAAGLFSALLFRKTLLKGPSSVLAIELPSWRVPSVRTAVRAATVRSLAFLRKAGTTILVMMIALWWLSSYPHVPPAAEAEALRAEAATQASEDAKAILARADQIDARAAARGSFMGRIGRTVQPLFAPLGYDWQLTIGVMSSFAAREVFVSTMSVVLTGSEDGVIDRMQAARRDDGSLVFNRPTLVSLLVFYILAMQCLPTLAVTAREAGGLKWALLQLGWMSTLAYLAAMGAYQILVAIGA
ncbi:MAG: ferrous iron transporter B [Phycisphaerales bacterium]|nr:ferrous iron transporter B [Phycisphaerales bacterium]